MQGEKETTTPESVDVAGAVALMDGLADDAGEAGRQDGSADGGNAHEEGGEATEQQTEGEETEPADDQEGESEQAEPEAAEADAAPDFWSAEDKAAWDKVPPELRPIVKKYEQQRVSFVNEKAREAAQLREQAQQEVRKYADTVDQAARWWQQAGPVLQQAFAGKWQKVNWSKLAEKNPAEYVKLRAEAETEAGLLAEAERRGQQDIRAAHQRAEQAFQQARHTEHAKVAAELPEFFGTAEQAARTYDALGNYLFAQGISADRINQIHEAPIIRLALKAWRFDQAQKKASTALAGKTGQAANTTGNATPTRVQPGPAARTGNRASEAARQVGERFRRSGGTSIADAAELIRLNGL